MKAWHKKRHNLIAVPDYSGCSDKIVSEVWAIRNIVVNNIGFAYFVIINNNRLNVSVY